MRFAGQGDCFTNYSGIATECSSPERLSKNRDAATGWHVLFICECAAYERDLPEQPEMTGAYECGTNLLRVFDTGDIQAAVPIGRDVLEDIG
jgi:hypothetical protein